MIIKTMLKNILLFCGYKMIKIRKQPERLNQIDSTITTTKIHYACGKNFFNGWLNVDLNKNKRGIGLTTVCIWYHFEYTSFLTIYTFMIQFD